MSSAPLPEALGKQSAPIWNGAQDVDDPYRNAVVALAKQSPVPHELDAFCTGILVTPRLVLTANHCINGMGEKGPIGDIENIEVRFGPATHMPLFTAQPLSRALAGYRSPLGTARTTDGTKALDIGLLLLANPVVSEQAFPVNPTFQRPVWPSGCGGMLSLYAGYGDSEYGFKVFPIKVSAETFELFVSAAQSPDKTFVAASDAMFRSSAEAMNLRAVFYNTAVRTVEGLVLAAREAGLVAVTTPTHPGRLAAASAPTQPWLALSGGRETLFELSSTPSGWQLRWLYIPAGEWVSNAVSGEAPLAPAAITYRYEDDSLYVLDLPAKKVARLLRIGRDGRSQVVASWKAADGPKARSWLATTYHGKLLLTVAKGRHYRIAELEVGGPAPKTTRQSSGHGKLAAGPRSDERGVTVAVSGNQGTLEVQGVTAWDACSHWQGSKCGPEWCFE